MPRDVQGTVGIQGAISKERANKYYLFHLTRRIFCGILKGWVGGSPRSAGTIFPGCPPVTLGSGTLNIESEDSMLINKKNLRVLVSEHEFRQEIIILSPFASKENQTKAVQTLDRLGKIRARWLRRK